MQIAESQKVMERGRPGPGLLAHILVSKHADALPLYRQSQSYDRYGMHIPDATLGEWCAFAIDVMRPMAQLVARCALASPYIHLDDTTLRVQDLPQLRGHLVGAHRVGCSRREAKEVIITLVLYVGWPATLNALRVWAELGTE